MIPSTRSSFPVQTTPAGFLHLGIMVLRKFELEGKLGEEAELIKSGVIRDENPLDDSPEFHDFLMACRRGDLKSCQELISRGVNINGKDRFDYTPLIVVSGQQLGSTFNRIPSQVHLNN